MGGPAAASAALARFRLGEDEGEDAAREAAAAGLVGAHEPFDGPLGRRQVVYADWTASGRALEPLEEFVRHSVLPFYANTHTTSSVTGLRSTGMRNEARHIILDCINGREDLDKVIFTGSGCTGAINKFAQLIRVAEIAAAAKKTSQRPVVFTSWFEHHSNLLPWREAGAILVTIPDSPDHGGPDLTVLEVQLRAHARHPLLVGSFSAASNVTGVCSDTVALAQLMHSFGGLACFDYACGGPYLDIDMNAPDGGHKDAIFVSPHKFLGGVNTAGVLVVKERVVTRSKPTVGHVGGGTVLWVTNSMQRYLSDLTEREEGGTPDIVGNIRAGLVFAVKRAFGPGNIERREHELVRRANQVLATVPNVVVLGPPLDADGVQRLPILSFLIRHGKSGQFLHHAFVSTLLNDLFGVQSRSGCMCAGPYAINLLGVTEEEVIRLSGYLDDRPYLKPGFTRLSLAYFASDAEVDFVLNAVVAVAQHGWTLLPSYDFDAASGEWRFRADSPVADLRHDFETKVREEYFEQVQQSAQELFAAALVSCKATDPRDLTQVKSKLYPADYESFAWFVFPEDVAGPKGVKYGNKLRLADNFIRPEKYWPNVQAAGLERVLSQKKKKQNIGDKIRKAATVLNPTRRRNTTEITNMLAITKITKSDSTSSSQSSESTIQLEHETIPTNL